jgi:hypothetical protein
VQGNDLAYTLLEYSLVGIKQAVVAFDFDSN